MEVLRNGKFSFVFKQNQMKRGIRDKENQTRNEGSFSEVTGMIGKDGSLVSLPSLTRIDTSVIADGFPYPQIFIFARFIIVCGQTKIYEYTTAGGLVEKLAVSAGSTWEAIDFYDYVYMSNGTVAVTRDAIYKTYSVTTDLPTFLGGCDYNGQVMVTSPDVA